MITLPKTDDLDKYPVITHERNIDIKTLWKALDIVKEFCITQELILYGGLGIDFALRKFGDSIYPENELPDYDMLSKKNVHDANKLGEMLADYGFNNISVIKGIHSQTMRVRVDFVPVADISYAPPKIFDLVPTIIYNGLKIVHPKYQKIDMHLSLSFPFSNPPAENIYHRFKKDVTRHNLLCKYYPDEFTDTNHQPKLYKNKLFIPNEAKNFALYGFSAYAALIYMYKQLVKEPKIPYKFLDLDFSYKTESTGVIIEYETPEPDHTLISVNYTSCDFFGEKTEDFAPFVDLQNNHSRYNGDTRVYFMPFQCPSIGRLDTHINVIGIHYLMVYILCRKFFCKILPGAIDNSDMYNDYYYFCKQMINEVSAVVRDKPNIVINSLPFMLTTQVLTSGYNLNMGYRISLTNNISMSKVPLPPDDPLNKCLIQANMLPMNYNPCVTRNFQDFIYTGNPIFDRAGQKI
uniref:Putative poly(A) polymerase catalytic subunit n=1 Tax=Abalone asfa-like virus TaxID=2839893 RepID=A0A5K7XX62_9VIRU|nr:polyA polymerase catalytic subunit homolog protein [Abalone asfa-like virus]BCY04556.1 Putative poly(A) polymerase catalytic subunit [Abalone asfa-like virus]